MAAKIFENQKGEIVVVTPFPGNELFVSRVEIAVGNKESSGLIIFRPEDARHLSAGINEAADVAEGITPPRPLKWEFYKSGRLHRWRATYTNGKRAGASTEGYHNLSECQDNARDFGWKGEGVGNGN